MTTPKKEVIYIDIEDDITAVINKLKQASASIVALVPPKRTGMLQSIVNLKLLNRAAETSKKRLVLITNDSALSGLAAEVKIPVAKNLQSKPELPEVTALSVDGEEVIDGQSLPVGSHAGIENQADAADAAPALAAAAPIAAEKALKDAPKKGAMKIPDFNVFKKRVLLIGGGLIALVVFLVWAIWFAPRAEVVIAAQTTPYNVSEAVSARSGIDLDAGKAVMPVEVVSQKQTNSVEFTATGKKEVGKKATGEVTFSSDSISRLAGGVTIQAGTELASSSGSTFVTNETVRLSITNNSDSTGITAASRGERHNGAAGSVSGGPDGINAEITETTSGGTDKTITVVSDADVAKARDQLEDQDDDQIRKQLEDELKDQDLIVIADSFNISSSDPSSSPAVAEEASEATLKAEATYTLVGVAKSDLEAVIAANVTAQLEGLPNQKIYQHGVDETRFSQFDEDGGSYKFTVETTAYVGPEINETELVKQLTNKVEGEIQETVKSHDGVKSVEVNFSPFWVNKIGSEDKINIRFDIENAD